MKKEIQNQFFEIFRLGASTTIFLIREKYGLHFFVKEKSLPEQKLSSIEEHLKNKLDSFDERILTQHPSPLFNEIEDNLLEYKTDREREAYLRSLIVEFRDMSEVIYPEKLFRRQFERELSIMKDEATINNKRDRYKAISDEFWRIATQPEITDAKRHKPTIEEIFSRLFGLMVMFSNKLDALCLKSGIDFFSLQEECNVWLNWHRTITDVGYYVGSEELAQKYINELPTGNDEPILNYEKLYKDSKQCTRITKLIETRACPNGVFTGFDNVKATSKEQMKITYQIVKERFLKPKYTDTKGSIRESCKIFFQRFGWIGYEEEHPGVEYCISLKKTTPAKSKANEEARQDLKLILK